MILKYKNPRFDPGYATSLRAVIALTALTLHILDVFKRLVHIWNHYWQHGVPLFEFFAEIIEKVPYFFLLKQILGVAKEETFQRIQDKMT